MTLFLYCDSARELHWKSISAEYLNYMELLTELSSNYFHLLPLIGSSELSSFCKLFYQNILFELCPEKSVFGSFKSDILNISRHKKHVIESRYMMGLS